MRQDCRFPVRIPTRTNGRVAVEAKQKPIDHVEEMLPPVSLPAATLVPLLTFLGFIFRVR